jgi:hypothetical protein
MIYMIWRYTPWRYRLYLLAAVVAILAALSLVLWAANGVTFDDFLEGLESSACAAEPDWQTFTQALGEVESNNDDQAVGDNGASIGRYQIGRAYWQDAVEHQPELGGRYEDVRDAQYARQIIRAYMSRYGARVGDWERMARLHNGGPRGPSKHSTLAHWRRVEKQMTQEQVEKPEGTLTNLCINHDDGITESCWAKATDDPHVVRVANVLIWPTPCTLDDLVRVDDEGAFVEVVKRANWAGELRLAPSAANNPTGIAALRGFLLAHDIKLERGTSRHHMLASPVGMSWQSLVFLVEQAKKVSDIEAEVASSDAFDGFDDSLSLSELDMTLHATGTDQEGDIDGQGWTNIDRGERAQQALTAYAADNYSEDEPASTILMDMLVDVRHFCRLTGIDFEEQLRLSARRHEEEAGGGW